MREKRSFLLLEVLLAVALVAIFAAPLMRWPIQHYQSQIDRLEEFERRRIADWTFTEIKEILLKDTIAWNHLPSKGETLTLHLPDTKIELPHLKPRKITRSYSLKCKGEKQSYRDQIFRLYYLEIHIDNKKTYRYRVLVHKNLSPTNPQLTANLYIPSRP